MKEELLTVTRSGVQIVSHVDWTLRQAVLSAKQVEDNVAMERAKDRPMRPRELTDAKVITLPTYFGSFFHSADRRRA